MKHKTLIFVMGLIVTVWGCNNKPEIDLTAQSIISVFPNPATTSVSIMVFAPENQLSVVKVFDKKGKEIKEQKGTGRYSFRFSLEGMPKGTYQLTLIINDTHVHKKFVKI